MADPRETRRTESTVATIARVAAAVLVGAAALVVGPEHLLKLDAPMSVAFTRGD